MNLLVLVSLAPAWAQASPRTLDDVIRASSAIVWGDVVSTSSCVSSDGSQAWTFVEVNPIEVLHGSLKRPDGSPLQSSDTFTYRLPVGPFGDGTFSTLGMTPRADDDDELILFLSYDASGNPLVMPYAYGESSVARVIPNGGVAWVVDGAGRPYLIPSGTFPVLGDPVPSARAYYLWDVDPVDIVSAASDLAAVNAAAGWTGSGVPGGPWLGRISLGLNETGGQNRKSSCGAYLKGSNSPSGLSLSGRCNADYAGATDVVLTGTRNGQGVWSGSVTFTPDALPSQSRTVSWTQSGATPDTVSGSISGSHTESGVSSTYAGKIHGRFVGYRRLLIESAFRNWVEDRAELVEPPNSVAKSVLSSACPAASETIEVLD